uniref:E3 ubiquitin-protein ligase CBL n=1 Tax=Rhabditophanes sp. KR3021 TaxID=114890 RepID=A0AC35U4V1_9BILA
MSTGFSGLLSKVQNLFSALPSSVLEDGFMGAASRFQDSGVKFNYNDFPNVSSAEGKVFEKTFKNLDIVMKLCQKQKLKLKASPPNVLDIVPELSKHVLLILSKDNTILKNYYFKQFITDLYSMGIKIIDLFKNSKEDIFEETSDARKTLTTYILMLSHMLSELLALSSDGKLSPTNFRITKKEPAEFWKQNFGDKLTVPWEKFKDGLERVHPISTQIEKGALKIQMDLTRNDHISQFEFDVFTRLFHPWTKLLDNWKVLAVTHPGYVSFMTYDQVKHLLQDYSQTPGSYVFRLSCTRLGQWAIGYVAPDGKIYQTIPANKSLVKALVDGNQEGFYRYPLGQTKNPDLTKQLTANTVGKTVSVTQEQFEIYCNIGSTFELCKICDEFDKDVRLEPCGHLLCKKCLVSWQETSNGSKNCPFCRCEIKGVEKVIVHAFNQRVTISDPADKLYSNSVKKAKNCSSGKTSSNLPTDSISDFIAFDDINLSRPDPSTSNNRRQMLPSSKNTIVPIIPPAEVDYVNMPSDIGTEL